MRQDDFFGLVDRLTTRLHRNEVLLCNLDGEDSDFVRLNGNRLRQAGSVHRRGLNLTLIQDQRQVEGGCDLAGEPDRDLAMADGLLELFPAEEVLDATIRHLVLDHVLPRLVSYQGRFVLHASGVADSECTILFLGPTGAGKSTLAASFIEDGLGLLTDDCVLLQSSEDGFSAQAAYAGLRLWPDSFAGLKPDEQPEPESHEGGWKRRLDIESMAGGPYKVRGIFILDSPTEGSPGGGVAVHPIEGADALMELLQHGFMLDPGDRDTIERQFLATGDVVEALPLYRLSYPRDFSRLPQVRQIIASALEDSGSTWAMSWEGLGIS